MMRSRACFSIMDPFFLLYPWLWFAATTGAIEHKGASLVRRLCPSLKGSYPAFGFDTSMTSISNVFSPA